MCVLLWSLWNSFFIEHLWTATSVFGKNFFTEKKFLTKNFTINYDLAKYPTTLTIIINFAENVWNFGVAMKQSENPI